MHLYVYVFYMNCVSRFLVHLYKLDLVISLLTNYTIIVTFRITQAYTCKYIQVHVMLVLYMCLWASEDR